MIENVTIITPLALFFLFLNCIAIISLPRDKIAIPLLFVTFYMTIGQQILIFSFNMTLLRILLFFGWIRIFMKKEYQSFRLCAIDKIFIAWIISRTLISIFRQPNLLVRGLGTAYNNVALYFFFRIILQEEKDFMDSLKYIAIMIIPFAFFFFIESQTGRNIFSVFGGVPAITAIRDGRLRCQGPFRHPVTAGVSGVTCLTLFLILWIKNKKLRFLLFFSIISSIVILITTSSGTPVNAFAIGMLGFFIWPLNKKMKSFRRGLLAMIIALDLYMKAPIWFLISRVSQFTGGTGWYRSYLINQFIVFFREWWLIGTSYTAHWMHGYVLSNPNHTDLANTYVSEGVAGGLLTLSLFIYVIVKCYKLLGHSLKKIGDNKSERMIQWMLGITLTQHVVSYISSLYYDQIQVLWYFLLGSIVMYNNLYSKDKKQKIMLSTGKMH